VQPAAIATRSELAAILADETAFRTWYERALPRVYGYLYHRCGRNPVLAEELAQQAFVEAVRSRRRFRGESDPTTWVIGIARHRLIDHYRREARDHRRRADLALVDLDATEWPSAEPAPDGIDDALGELPAQHRAVLVLHYMDGLSVREAARVIGRSEPATASLLARARDGFRRAYGEESE
jgi:RNA polymerase sigma-70 factor (ECF subfamily)